MDKKSEILYYCQRQGRALTAKEIVAALYPGKRQPQVNSAINELVMEKKLIRIDTRPYTVHVPEAGEAIPEPKQYERGPNGNSGVEGKAAFSVPRPCPDEVEKYLLGWEKLEDYRLQESALDKLFFELCPENKCIEDVLIKAAALNDFYSTNIFSVYPVAKHILTLQIDERLLSGDLSLVNDIATVPLADSNKNFYSFATKYCSHHQPKRYAIYDSYVHKVLLYFREKDGFSNFSKEDLKNYVVFHRILDRFRQFYGLQQYSLKMLDRYLWQLGKAVFPKKYN